MKITTTVQEIILDDCICINDGDNDIVISRNRELTDIYTLSVGNRVSILRGVYYIFSKDGESYLTWFATAYISVQSKASFTNATTSYTTLTDLPQIEGATIIGNKTMAEYGVDSITDSEIDDAWSRA